MKYNILTLYIYSKVEFENSLAKQFLNKGLFSSKRKNFYLLDPIKHFILHFSHIPLEYPCIDCSFMPSTRDQSNSTMKELPNSTNKTT